MVPFFSLCVIAFGNNSLKVVHVHVWCVYVHLYGEKNRREQRPRMGLRGNLLAVVIVSQPPVIKELRWMKEVLFESMNGSILVCLGGGPYV